MRSGRSPEETLMMLIPEAYMNHPTLQIKYPEVSILDRERQLRQAELTYYNTKIAYFHINSY